MNRKEITKFLSQVLEHSVLNSFGKHYAKEVIPVSVRYPDNAREVLVTIKRTENGKSRYMIDKAKCIHDIYTDRTVWDSYDYGAIGISNAKHMEVTAWIELPEPYMGE